MKERLDKILVDKNLVKTRSQAKSLIEKGDVLVNGKRKTKAGELFSPDEEFNITSKIYVGRGAFKLEKALEIFSISVKDLTILDVGASTGGFTQVLLENGAKKVFAIDVGRDQLDPDLRADPRVINLEGVNIKDLDLTEFSDGAVIDLSFISVTKVLAKVKSLLKPETFVIILVKPQFEVGIERLPKDGVVKDRGLQETVLREIETFSRSLGFNVLGSIDSPIEGKLGNREFLTYLKRLD